MTRWIFFIVLTLAAVALVVGCGQKEEQTQQMQESTPEGQVVSEKIFDPVCGMQIGSETSYKAEYEGKTYYFCSAECHEKFMQAPEKYMSSEGHHMEGESHEGHGH